MKRYISSFWVLVWLIFYVTACSSGGTTEADIDTTDETTLSAAYQNAQTLQGLIPVINASFSVFQSSGGEASSSESSPFSASIGLWNTPQLPATPQKLFDANYDKTDGFARYPATGYLEDFYSEDGNLAYMKLAEATDGWGDYQVSLYIHPTLSPSIHYTLEKYRVPMDDWTCFISEEDGTCDSIAFEEISSHYFDGRIEYRDLLWSRYVDGTVYTADFFKMPDDFTSDEYEFPEEITDPTRMAAVDVQYLEEYASKETYFISPSEGCDISDENPCRIFPSEGHCSSLSGTEFYTILLDEDGQSTKYSKSFATEDVVFKDGYRIENKTVQIYSIDPDSNKTVMSKTIATYSWKGTSRVATITNRIRVHDDDADGLTDYESTFQSIPTENYAINKAHPIFKMETLLTLEESERIDNSYEGTMAVSEGATTKQYKVMLDAVNGLVIIPEVGEELPFESLNFPINDINQTEDSVDMRKIVVEFENSSFEGFKKDDIIYGTLTDSSGKEKNVVAGPSFAAIEIEDRSALLGQWRMDEGSGKVACDSVNDNHGAINGAVWDTGIAGNTLGFDGIDDYVDIAHLSDYDIVGGMSFSAWVKNEEHKTAKILELGDWDGHGIYQDKWNGWKTHFRIDGKSYSIDWDEKRPDLGRWYHIVGTFDGSQIVLYVDGMRKNAIEVTGSLSTNSRPVYIGATGGQKYFTGLIDEAAIFNRALTTEEVYEIYKSTLPEGNDPSDFVTEGLVSYWSFDNSEVLDDLLFNLWGDQSAENRRAVTDTEGRIDEAFEFVGTSCIKEIKYTELETLDGMSVEAWVKWNVEPSKADNWANIVNKFAPTTGWAPQYQIQHDRYNSKFEFAISTSESKNRYVWSTTTPKADEWYHVAGTYDGSTMTIYVNGEKENSANVSGDLVESGDPLYIGSRDCYGRFFQGTIDEVKIYDRALTAEEIGQNYNATNN